MKYTKLLIVFALFVGMFAGSISLSRTMAESTGFDDIIVDDAAITGSMVVSGNLTQNGDLAHFENDIEVAGDITGLNIVTMRKPAWQTNTITVTNGMTMTADYGSYRLNAAGAVGLALNACTVDGQLLTLYGEDAQTITLADSNIRTSDGGVVAIGQYDLATFQCFKNEWILIAKIANS